MKRINVENTAASPLRYDWEAGTGEIHKEDIARRMGTFERYGL